MTFTHLEAGPTSDLNWSEISQEESYFLDFGAIDLNNPTRENANILAVEEFAKRYPRAKQVILAKTDGRCEDPNAFSDYLHRLAAYLPEETTPILLCDFAADLPFEELVLAFCRRRFEHITLLFKGRRIPIEGEESVAVAIPADDRYDRALFKKVFSSIDVPFKCIPEEHLNEHWDGVDLLIVEPTTLGDMGKRMLLGFEAAGGEVLYRSI